MRIGYGFDSHEFRAGIPLKIGGVALAHDRGLGGHSDGDVLLHAITDALLGSVAELGRLTHTPTPCIDIVYGLTHLLASSIAPSGG